MADFVCIASGPSLTADDCDFVRGKAKAIAVNTSFCLAPWADYLLAQDDAWWKVYGDEVAETFHGERVNFVKPQYGRIGNSGHAAIEFAIQRGASRVILLGYDYGNGTHWHGEHDQDIEAVGRALSNPGESEYGGPDSPWHRKINAFASKCPVPVLNASRETTITCFPRVSLYEALADRS